MVDYRALAHRIILDIEVLIWDFILVCLNFISSDRRPGHVVPKDYPGAGGKWPEYIAPTAGASRSPCPWLNTLANHGILPRDGRNVTFPEITRAATATCNFAPSYAFFVTHFAAMSLKRNYHTETLDLEELSKHNMIEHDASLTRRDAALQPDQGKPDPALVDELLAAATGKGPDGSPVLTEKDISRVLAKRRAESRAANDQYWLDAAHKMFGSANSSTLLAVFGGRVRDLEVVLKEERIPDGWEGKDRSKMGVTMLKFNVTALKVEFGASTQRYTSKMF